MSGAGLEIGTPPLGAALNAGQLGAQDIGLFINQHVGYAQPSATGQNLQIVKREPEDLSHHRRLDNASPEIDAGSILPDRLHRPKVTI